MIEPLAGKLIDDRYQIIRRLGEGGMGTVYLASESELNRIVAIKMLHHGLLADEEHRARFEREGKVLSSLLHPNILKFYRFGLYQNQQPYIVMEYLEGHTLTEFMESGFPGLDTCLHIAIQITDGLHFAHNHQIVHRDIKPPNVFIQDNALVKLVDFGLARVVDGSRRQNLTQTGALIGSVFYMSPEQCVGKPADSRSDIYSLGCLLFEMFAGQAPFTADNPVGLMHLHANAPIPTIVESPNTRGLDKDVVQVLDSILSKCMAKNPDERYQDMLALQTDLKLLQQGRIAEIVQHDIQAERRKHQGKFSTTIAIVLACAALSLVAAPTVRNRLLSPAPSVPGSTQESSAHPLSFHAKVQSMTRMAAGEKRLRTAILLAKESQRQGLVPPIEIRHVYFTIADDGRSFLTSQELLQHLETGLLTLRKAGADPHLLSLMYDKKAQVLNRKEEYDQAIEAAKTALSLLKKSDCTDEELEASSWSTICDAERLKGNNLAKAAPQLEALLNQLKEKDYFAAYVKLAPNLAFIYALDKQTEAEEKLFKHTLSFMADRPAQLQLELMQAWLAKLQLLTQGHIMPVRMNMWLERIKPTLSEQDFTAIAVDATNTFLVYGFFGNALETLRLTRCPDTTKGGDLHIAKNYQICKARTLLWTGNKTEGIKEIDKVLRSHPNTNGSGPEQALPNLAAACWRSDLPEYVDPLLNQFERLARKNPRLTPKSILFDYDLVLNSIPPARRPEIGAKLMERVENLIKQKTGSIPRTAQAQIAVKRARFFAQRDQFETGLAAIEPFLKDKQELSDDDLRELHLLGAQLLFSCNRDTEANRQVELYLLSGDTNKTPIVDLYMPLIDMYDLTGKYDKAESYAKRALAQAPDQNIKLSLVGKLSTVYLNEGKPELAVALLAPLSPPKPSSIQTYVELAAWQGYQLCYLTALRRQGNPVAAYKQAESAVRLMKRDPRAASVRPVLEMLTCICEEKSSLAKAERMNALLEQIRGPVRESTRGPYFYQYEVLESILLIEQGAIATGLERLTKVLEKCRSAHYSYASLDSFKLAERVYRKLGKFAQAEQCLDDIDEAVKTLRGQRYLTIHKRLQNQIRRGEES
ncbi:MAG: protein kinase [Candidatus Obscuribacterales bacterium]|nr:protein kinase [Candidatus Obscuribacterales bacterium]